MSDQIDIVVRFHDAKRLLELERCVFSLVSQTYRPVHIILSLQRFSPDDIAVTRAALAPLFEGEDALTLSVVNYDKAEYADARSVLMNLGLSQARGRYLAFIDYDDVLYPEAYELLVSRLTQTGAAIAFASVRTMRLHVYDHFLYAESDVEPFIGLSVLDLFRSNFCPLHSYVMDRQKIPSDLLRFRPSLTMEEDYDVLLRICARVRSDFGLLGTYIGDYNYKTDGSNTVPTDGTPTEQERDHYTEIQSAIEERRRTTIISPAVQRLLGLPESDGPMTIREIIKRFPRGRSNIAWTSQAADSVLNVGRRIE